MIQVLLMLMVGSLVAHDALPSSARHHPEQWSWWVAGLTLAPMLAMALTAHGALRRCGAGLDRDGMARHLVAADRVITLTRIAAAGFHAWAVLSLGWLDCVRGVVGDIPAGDELLALAPALGVIAAGWASYFDIDRRLREASFIGSLDESQPVRTMPTRWQYVSDQVRHHVLILLVPITGISAWSESVDLGARRFLESRPELAHAAWVPWALSGVHFLGVALVLLMMPWGLRHLWNTSRLASGPIRERLARLCEAQKVRVRDYLVWHTHTGMINGALVGLLPGMRYILLTDALLERMTEAEVEAVMAHEVAHAARRHIPWLGVSIAATVGLSDAVLAWAGPRFLPAWSYVQLDGGERVGPEFLLSLALGIAAFGWVSRRFERQADAFAAQHLSGWSPRRRLPAPAPAITPEAAGAMSDALAAVSRFAHLPQQKFTFRHGSIIQRRRNVMDLVGVPSDRIAIDRTVRRIKTASLIGVVALILIAVFT